MAQGMGAEVRLEAAPVAAAALPAGLGEEPTGFDFMQAVRLLERVRGGRAGPGVFADPADELVRFGAHLSIAFPPAEIQALQPGGDGEPHRMLVNFFGLTGPQGVLPHEYTLLAAERQRTRDGALAAFLDMFNHRAISLLYRAWRRNRFTVLREQREQDPVTGHLLDLLGAGLSPMAGQSALPDETLAHLAGVLGPRPRSAAALEQAVEALFGVPAEVEQFVGAWQSIEDADRCELGEAAPAAALGRGAVAGDEIWDAHAGVRVRLGPMDREALEAFLPGGPFHEPLRALTRQFSADQHAFELLLVLKDEAVPGLVVGGDAGERLGWTTWIRTEPVQHGPAHAVLTLQHPGRKSA
jgi:type VI secretion system protein ImpH